MKIVCAISNAEIKNMFHWISSVNVSVNRVSIWNARTNELVWKKSVLGRGV